MLKCFDDEQGGKSGEIPALPALVLVGKHDGQHSGGFLRVGGVFAAAFQVGAVIVDLPENPLPVVGERAEIPFAMLVIVRGEILVIPHHPPDGQLVFRRQGMDASGYYGSSAWARAA